MSGLATLAWMERRCLEVLAAPPLDHNLRPTTFNGFACFPANTRNRLRRPYVPDIG
jgi:hypothetical protein